MAHFYGLVTGNTSKATRCGTKDSGMTATAASWDGAIRTDIWYDSEEDVNRYVVLMIPWRGAGVTRILKTGIVGRDDSKEAA